VPREKQLAQIEAQGTWVYLLIQMFAFEWAMAYSTVIPYGQRSLCRQSGEEFLMDISDDMDAVMRGH
jgi:hypothetical protein